jgi:hypothetical protein
MFIETYYDERAAVPASTSEPMIPYPELSGEELTVWQEYLPMRRQIRRPSKFIVLADSMKSAINMAYEHGGADFQSRFDKSTAQAEQMKEGVLRVL